MLQKEQLKWIREMLETAYEHQDMTAVTRLSQLLDQYALRQAEEQLNQLDRPA